MEIYNNVEIFKFLDGDVNPTVKKVGKDGNFTNEIYNKDDVINTLSDAIKNGNISSVIKETNPNDEYLNYHFNFSNNKKIYSTISIQIKNNSFGTKTITVPVQSSNDNINSRSKYISLLDNMVTENIRVKNSQKREKILNIIGAGAFIIVTMGGIAYSLIKTDMKEQEINSKTNQQYIEEFNQNRRQNGIEEIKYAGLEQTVDDAIEESITHGRKL